MTETDYDRLKRRLQAAEIILAKALTCNNYHDNHLEWLNEAIVFLNSPSYISFAQNSTLKINTSIS